MSITLLAVATILVLVPFLFMISLAFTPESEAFKSVSLVPSDPTGENFARVLGEGALVRALLNSLIVTVIAVLGNLLLAITAGYGFARLPFRGSGVIFYAMVATVAIPIAVTLIPLFLIVKQFPLTGGNNLAGQGGTGLLNTLVGVALPLVVVPMNVFLARQYFSTLDADLAEAARVDGAGEWRIFAQIYVPLARPLIAVVAIFSFTAAWDDFLWPLVVTSSQDMQTVQLALTRYIGKGNIQYGALMAATVLATVPVLVVFIFNQRHFVAGLTEGSVKG